MNRLVPLIFIATVVILQTAEGALRLNAAAKKAFLTAHNNARKAEKKGLPALKWDNALANKVAGLVNKCQFQHTPNGIRKWGENLYASSGQKSPADAARQSVKLWVAEKKFNTNGQFTCQSSSCGHYTQVIWKKTTKVGCAINRCKNNKSLGTFVACAYSPPGNYRGQKPY